MPLPYEAVRLHADVCRVTLVFDECRATRAGIADPVIADLPERGVGEKIGNVRARDTYISPGPAATTVLIQDDDIIERAFAVAAN